MFGGARRHRPPNPPLNSATANPNAASAAATAFMSASNQKPNRSLSSAAAAAALRARPHTPTNVGEVQTKRTLRRSASVSSAGSSAKSATGSRPTAQLQRKGSSGSMTERTFRSPSPRRNSSIQATEQHPPVPQIPAGHKKSASHTSAGVGMQTFRTASQKIKSGHSSWYTEPSGDPRNVRTSDAPMKSSKLQPLKSQNITTTPQRPDSRSSSVNFSYPTAYRAQSPPASPTSGQAPQFASPPPRKPASPPTSNRASISSMASGKSEQPMVYDPNSRRMIPKVTVDNVGFYVNQAAEKQPKKKKYGGLQREGSHLAKGTVARVKGTAVDAGAGERTLPKREQPVVETTPTAEELRILEEPSVKAIITTSAKSGRPQESEGGQSLQLKENQKSSGVSSKPQSTSNEPNTKPPASRASEKKSAFIEEPERIPQEDTADRPSQKVLDALDAVPTRQSVYEQPEDPRHLGQDGGETSTQYPVHDENQGFAVSPIETTTDKRASFAENKPVAELVKEGIRSHRSASNSPARQAHFSVTPSDKLGVRHTPLPRSASPIKSALKRTSPTRGEVSPSDKSSDISGSRGASPHQQEETAAPRKKSVRVSFDDRTMATVVGESASPGDIDSPVPLSPQQAKRPWYSNIGRSKRREFTLDDDEIMKPRPALPSFGSIREKKIREPEERPLVRPQEPSHSPVAPSSPELHPSSPSVYSENETPDEQPLGASSDRGIGSIFAQAQTSRNAPNISRFREPLPPVVTSVEGSGYISDSLRSSDSDDDLLNSVGGGSDTEEFPNTQITQPETQDNSQSNSAILEGTKQNDSEAEEPSMINLPQEVPDITVIQPSPRLPEKTNAVDATASSSKINYFEVPGGFPEDGSDTTRNSQTSSRTEGDAPVGTSSTPPIFEPKAAIHPVQPETLPQTTLATTAPLEEVDDKATDDSASIYSDAYEEISDAEGDGFLSLNAVVEKPIDRTPPPKLAELPGDAQKEADTTPEPQANKRLDVIIEPPKAVDDKDDWEQAKAFWRSLTAEKRQQLEREALEDAGAEGDEEEVVHPVRRNSSRKKASQKKETDKVQPQPSKPAPKPVPEPTSAVNLERAPVVQPLPKSTQEHAHQPSTSSRMRTSLRADKPGQLSDGMRKTMRPQTSAGQAVQSSARRSAQREKPTPVLSKSNHQQNTTVPSQKLSKAAGGSLPSEKPTLQRRGSDASDSSFKRTRATRNGGFNFRHSMRPQSAGGPQEVTKGSGRFSLRSLSPTGSSFRHSTGDGAPVPNMRHTLRSSSISSQDRILPSLHFPSFGRSNKAPTTKRSKRSSRFGDGSSDEDEGGISGFRSRFDDSSDEDVARPSSSSRSGPLAKGTLRPSTAGAGGFRKSTPVPEVDEESPELPDSDDNMPSPLQSPQNRASTSRAGISRSNSEALGTATLTRSRSGRGGFNTTVSIPTSPTKQRRTSLMGILKRNKRTDSSGKIQRSELTESAARRDTRLERSNEQLRDIRSSEPSSPKLQKRNSVKRNDSWPLSEPGDIEHMKRSNSAGNLISQTAMGGAVQRPDFSSRRSTSLGIPAIAYEDTRDNVTMDGLGHRKKKKFGALRRMFGLDE
ncbi:uncharacterized protein F4822DRAFT_116329 [Hypoxylon trugodes]|uniref:uncharacterized protein n=1 Tax=Hypoxylon trugodes TaxID=326681 RepID=UPI002198D8FA|nr:uncharacterized protein F4822DRAFT_116329 [Hypoxylon trugodes]KAI1392131.1 hypothetical protein F4822DRAFT_116329 [Hypoxylon trugodes]